MFIAIGIIGVVVLVLALVLGDLVDLGAHVEFGGDAFSTAALAGFAAAFGFGGAIAESLFGQWWLSVVVGVLVGVAVAAGVVKLTQALRRSGTSDTVSTSSLVGLEAVVISSIPAGGFGEVHVRAHGHQLKLNARAETTIAQGERVWVSGVVSPTAVEVRDTDPIDTTSPIDSTRQPPQLT